MKESKAEEAQAGKVSLGKAKIVVALQNGAPFNPEGEVFSRKINVEFIGNDKNGVMCLSEKYQTIIQCILTIPYKGLDFLGTVLGALDAAREIGAQKDQQKPAAEKPAAEDDEGDDIIGADGFIHEKVTPGPDGTLPISVKCPSCGCTHGKLAYGSTQDDDTTIRRQYSCPQCGGKFITAERVAQ